MTGPRLTHAQAFKILNTPPVVVDEFYVRTRIGYEGTRTLRYEYSSVEVQEFRTIVLASDTGWQNGLERMK